MKSKRLLWKLVPTYLAITFGSMIMVGWLATITVRRFYLSDKEADLKVRAQLVKHYLSGHFSADNRSSLDSYCKSLGRISVTRITLIDFDGVVLGDSDDNPALMENHSDRPEVKTAKVQPPGVSIRYSTTVKKWMMYLAVPIDTDRSEQSGVVRVAIPLTTVKDALAGVYLSIALGGLFVAILASLISYFISRRISNPLASMTRGAQLFAAGELDHRLIPPDTVELGDLARAINQMAADLNERIQTITQQRNELEAVLSSMVEGVFAVDMEEKLLKVNLSAEVLFGIEAVDWQGRTLTEIVRNPDLQRFVSDVLLHRHTSEGEIVIDSDKFLQVHGTLLHDATKREIGALFVMNDITRLRKLENIRRDFAASVSHELRTPITSIKGFAETLKDGAIEDPQSAERFLDIIIKHTDRLNAIIEDLLSLARIEQDAESDKIKLESGSIREVVKTAARLCEPKTKEKEITIEVCSSEDYKAPIAASLLERAIVNLLDNAVNYSERGSSVQIGIEKQESEIIIAVKDSGCGIASEHIPRIFERFYRVDADRSRKLGGTGLGLAIVKHVALAHNGRVSVESKPGKGSIFRIHLPE